MHAMREARKQKRKPTRSIHRTNATSIVAANQHDRSSQPQTDACTFPRLLFPHTPPPLPQLTPSLTPPAPLPAGAVLLGALLVRLSGPPLPASPGAKP